MSEEQDGPTTAVEDAAYDIGQVLADLEQELVEEERNRIIADINRIWPTSIRDDGRVLMEKSAVVMVIYGVEPDVTD